MTITEARVPTDRANRYLEQLCRHLSQLEGMRHRPPVRHGDGQQQLKIEHVDYSDTYGTVRFAQGLLTLRATSDALTLLLEADDETLPRLRNGIAGRIEKIGRRDGLAVTWTQPQAPEGPPGTAGAADAPKGRPVKRRWLGQIIGLGAAGVLVLVVHLGLFGATLAASAWAVWGLNAIVALIALKVVTVAVHVILARLGIRRGKSLLAHRKRHHTPGPAASTAAAPAAAGIGTGKEQP